MSFFLQTPFPLLLLLLFLSFFLSLNFFYRRVVDFSRLLSFSDINQSINQPTNQTDTTSRRISDRTRDWFSKMLFFLSLISFFINFIYPFERDRKIQLVNSKEKMLIIITIMNRKRERREIYKQKERNSNLK